MESPSLQEENIIKNVRKRFILEKLKKEITDTTIKAKRNLFRLEKENEKLKISGILGTLLGIFLCQTKKTMQKDIKSNHKNLILGKFNEQ